MRYTTRTDRADQNKVPRNEATHGTLHSTLYTDPEEVEPSTIDVS